MPYYCKISCKGTETVRELFCQTQRFTLTILSHQTLLNGREVILCPPVMLPCSRNLHKRQKRSSIKHFPADILCVKIQHYQGTWDSNLEVAMAVTVLFSLSCSSALRAPCFSLMCVAYGKRTYLVLL